MKILEVPELRKWNNQEKLKSQVWKLMAEMNFQRPVSSCARSIRFTKVKLRQYWPGCTAAMAASHRCW